MQIVGVGCPGGFTTRISFGYYSLVANPRRITYNHLNDNIFYTDIKEQLRIIMNWQTAITN